MEEIRVSNERDREEEKEKIRKNSSVKKEKRADLFLSRFYSAAS